MNGRRNHFIYANPCQGLGAAAVSGELCPSGLTWEILLSTETLSLLPVQELQPLVSSTSIQVNPPQQKQGPVQILWDVPLL